MSDNLPIALAVAFVPLSFVSFGGGVSALPAIQRQAVDIHSWVTPREFLKMFAISRTAPGPGLMLIALIGWKVAGWLGAFVATLAIFAPAAVLCFSINRIWTKYQDRHWHRVLAEGLAPVGTGLIGAGVILLLDLSGAGPVALATSAATAIVLFLKPSLSPTLALFTAAAVFSSATLLTHL